MALGKGVEIIAGILLLTGRFIPLTLIVLASIIVNYGDYSEPYHK